MIEEFELLLIYTMVLIGGLISYINYPDNPFFSILFGVGNSLILIFIIIIMIEEFRRNK